MRFLKLALISCVVLFIILTAISFLIPSTIVVSRSVEIHESRDSILHLLNDLSQWNRWLEKNDSSTVSVSPLPAVPGAVLTMNHTTVTLESADSIEVHTIWKAEQGRQMRCVMYLLAKKDASTSSLQWQFIRHLKWYPWEKFSSIASEKVLGPYIENNLENIKRLLNK